MCFSRRRRRYAASRQPVVVPSSCVGPDELASHPVAVVVPVTSYSVVAICPVGGRMKKKVVRLCGGECHDSLEPMRPLVGGNGA